MTKYCLVVTFTLIACGPTTNPGNTGGAGGSAGVGGSAGTGGTGGSGGSGATGGSGGMSIDGMITDGGSIYGDADTTASDGGCGAATCTNPVNDNCIGQEICGDGLDNNCNGQVDEGCTCTPGAVQACFLGPPGRRNVGACQDGTQRCQGSGEFGIWGPCTGGISPSPEQCDTVDNNCNGCVDDNPMCCRIDLMCPTSMPDGQPYTDYVINGATFWTGSATSWSWTVTGGPCDQLLYSSSGHVSYTLNGANTTMVATPQITFHPTLSGDYTFVMTVVDAQGVSHTCTFIVHIRGPGLRAELCWDTTGSSDVDLHVHKPGTTSSWFTTNGQVGGTINTDDCYYYNCKATTFATRPNWGYANSAISECVGSQEGAQWQALNYCANPRLDVDNISTVGIPENTNVDNPANNQTFRVMVHYYGGSGTTHPMVNVYCGGHLLGTYGAAPDLVTTFTAPGGFARGPMWRVVDATTMVDASGNTTGCTLTPLHPPGSTSGYYVTNNNTTY